MLWRQRIGAGVLVAGALSGLSGCVANSSNPVVSVREASMNDNGAELVLAVHVQTSLQSPMLYDELLGKPATPSLPGPSFS